MQQFNDAGLSLLKEFEGCKLARYNDLAGVSTIGYGHTGPLPQPALDLGWPAYPDTIPQMAADWLLWYDAQQFSAKVAALISSATDNQFAAMVSLAYNIGVGAFRTSSVLREHIAGKFASAAAAFLLWDKAHEDGQLVEVAGLFRRRTAEATLYQQT